MIENSTAYPFLAGGGEMGELTRRYDWAQTALGSPRRWPTSLRTLVNMMLSSRFPMLIFWGPELITFYNDAFRPSLGDNGKHPSLLGQKGEQSWAESWPVIGPMIYTIMAGGDAVWFEDQKLPIYRDGQLSYAYWTYSFSPVVDDDGAVNGVLVTCCETTKAIENHQKLADSRDQLEFAIEATELGIWDLDPITDKFTANTRLKEWFGLAPEEEVDLALAISVIDEKDRDHVAAAIEHTLDFDAGGRYDTEYTIVHPETRQERIVRAKGRAWFTEEKTAYRLNGTLQDITEQRKSELARAENERTLRSVVSDAPFPIGVYIGREMRIQLANQAIIDVWGKGPDVIGKLYADVLPELAGQAIFAQLDEVFTSGIAFHARHQQVDIVVEGSLRPFYFNYSFTPLLNADGQVYGVMNTAAEVTDLVLASQKIERSQRQVLASFEQSPVAIAVLVNPNLTFWMANTRYCELVGQAADQLIGQPVAGVLPGAESRELTARLQDVMATGIPYVAKEVLAVSHCADGDESRYFDFAYQPWREHDQIVGVMIVATDITRQVTARREIEASEAKFRTLIEEAPVSTCLFVGPEMRIEVINDVMLGYWGKDKRVIGKPLVEVLPELKDQAHLTLLDEVYATGKTYRAHHVRADLQVNGSLRTYYFDLIHKPLLDANGQVYGIMDMSVDVTEQVLARQKIEASENKLRGLIAAAPAGIGLFVGRDLIIEHPNQTFIDIVGKGPAVEGLPLREAMPELLSEGQPFLAILDDIFTTGVPFVSPASLVKIVQNGVLNDNYYNISYTPIYDAAGEIYAILDIAIDVTAQVKAQQALAESEARFRTLAEGCPIMIAVSDESSNATYFNRAWVDLTGWPLEELLAFGWVDRVHPDDREQYVGIYLDAFAVKGPFTGEFRVLNALDEYRWLLAQGTARFDTEGVFLGYISACTDVTERRQQQLALEENEAVLRNAVEVAELGTWTMDLVTGAAELSPRHLDMFGLAQQPVTMQEVVARIVDTDVDRVTDAFSRAQQPGSDGQYLAEYAISGDKAGKRQLIRSQGQTHFDAQGKPVRIAGISQNITLQRAQQLALENEVQQRTEELASVNKELAAINEELAVTNEELHASNEEYMAVNEELTESTELLIRSNNNLQQFAYVASHDLQEPLRKIQAFGDILKDRFGEQLGDGVDFLTRMQAAASRMSILIRDLLSFSRVSTQREANLYVSLTDVVAKVLADLELVIQETDAVVEVDALNAVHGDALQLGQLFQNLLTNALKFRRPGVSPVIHVTAQLVTVDQLPAHVKPTRTAVAYHRIDVADNGIGFDEKYLDRIFQVFQRLHGRSDFAGTGIGLAISERVVANHGGAITASSQPGQGATFSVYLPA